MYDAREEAIRDRTGQLDAARQEGEDTGRVEGKIEIEPHASGLRYLPVSDEKELSALGLEQLDVLTTDLQEQFAAATLPTSPPTGKRNRAPRKGVNVTHI